MFTAKYRTSNYATPERSALGTAYLKWPELRGRFSWRHQWCSGQRDRLERTHKDGKLKVIDVVFWQMTKNV